MQSIWSVLPQDWKVVALGKILGAIQGGTSVITDERIAQIGELGVLKTSAVSTGCFRPSESKAVSATVASDLKVYPKANGILINRKNTPELVGTSAFVENDTPDRLLPDLIWQLEVVDEKLFDPRWLAYVLSLNSVRKQISRRANGTAESMMNITRPSLQSVIVPCPPYPEQVKIANSLKLQDMVIDKTAKLIAAKCKQKSSLEQNLLTGKLSFPQFDGQKWHEYHLGQVFKERKEINRGDLPLLSITASRGVIPQEETEKIDTSNADKSKYKRIAPGDIGYNTMRMWQGVSALSTLEGIVSPAYTVCIPKRGILAEYARHLFKFPPMVHLFWRYSQGLVDDTLNLKFHNFAQIKVKLPGIPEQRKIAGILDSAASEIEQLQKQLESLQKQKKGLMQQLLTGQKKVM